MNTNNSTRDKAILWWNKLPIMATPYDSPSRIIYAKKYYGEKSFIYMTGEQIEHIYNSENPSPVLPSMQEESKEGFTKGNWEIFIQPCEKELTRTINVGSKRIATLQYTGNQNESEANANLIAAAPELYKLAKRIAFVFGNDKIYTDGSAGYGMCQTAKAILQRIGQ